MPRLCKVAWIAIACAACGGSGSGDEADAGVNLDASPTTDGPPRPVRPDARPPSACPEGEFATGVDVDGMVQCSSVAATAIESARSHCSIFAGWRDSCNGCTLAPSKWGVARDGMCANGLGSDNSCSVANLGGTTVSLFGLNPDGDVGDDDKFYLGWQCDTPDDTPVPGPCPDGSFVSAVTDNGVECVTAQGMIVDYLAANCDVYFGWRDSCDNCLFPPTKYARANSTSCSPGIGANNTCTTANLGGSVVRLLGVNTDGDVDGGDKFYIAFHCAGASTDSDTVPESCPPGQLVIGRDTTGVQCASPLPVAEVAVQDSCSLYFGWRDNCDGCTISPAKFGRVSHAACANGLGLDNTCVIQTLLGTQVQLFGLNTDGDVNGDDKFYVGMSCP